MKRKIDNLEDHVRRIEEENSMLREFNEIFSNESNELCEENKALREELQQSKQLHIPRKIINPPQPYSPKRPNKRLKSREESPDEVAAADARVRILQDYLQLNCVNVYIQLFIILLFPLIV